MSFVSTHPLSGAAYLLLAISAAALVARKQNFSTWFACLSLVAALFGGIVSIEAVFALAAFLVLCLWHFSLRRGDVAFTFPGATMLSGLLVVAAAVTFAGHFMPGFHNAKIIDHMVMSPGGVPFTMYLDFDKVAAAWILARCGGFFPVAADSQKSANEQADARRSLVIGALCLGSCLAVIIPVSLAIGYIAFDPKIMPFFWIWAANNLIFVAFSEETLFRGMVQGSLTAGFTRLGWPAYAALLVSAGLFGLAHIAGGWAYVALAALAGLFYGAAFLKTNRLETSIAVHFLLNFIHAVFFTYPALHIDTVAGISDIETNAASERSRAAFARALLP